MVNVKEHLMVNAMISVTSVISKINTGSLSSPISMPNVANTANPISRLMRFNIASMINVNCIARITDSYIPSPFKREILLAIAKTAKISKVKTN
ncbi:hypothetical protein ACFL1Y_02090, partial [Patescibacteria group bacterium]